MGAVIYDMLAILLANYYDQETIFQAYQNNFVLPKNGKWVTITELGTGTVSRPEILFRGLLPQGTTTISNLDITEFQVDFYGEPSRKCCAWTRVYVQSADATNYLAAAGNMTVFKIGEMRNLTEVLDQRKYLPRFNFKFSVFNNTQFEYGQYGFDHDTVGLIRVP